MTLLVLLEAFHTNPLKRSLPALFVEKTMKKLAYKFKNFQSDIINIDEALRLRKNNPGYWENKSFFDLVKLEEMFPVARKKGSSSFSFRNSGRVGHNNGSKGIAHELMQELICKSDSLRLRIYGKEIDLTLKNGFDEWLVRDEKRDKKVFVDCCLELDEKSNYFEEFGGKVGIGLKPRKPQTTACQRKTRTK